MNEPRSDRRSRGLKHRVVLSKVSGRDVELELWSDGRPTQTAHLDSRISIRVLGDILVFRIYLEKTSPPNATLAIARKDDKTAHRSLDEGATIEEFDDPGEVRMETMSR